MPVTCTSFLVIPSGSLLKMIASWSATAGETPGKARFEFGENNELHFVRNRREAKFIEAPIRPGPDGAWTCEVECTYGNHAPIGRSLRFLTVHSTWRRRSGNDTPPITRKCGAFLS